MSAKRVVVDTNVFVYSLYDDQSQHEASKRLVEQSKTDEVCFCITQQVLAELYATVTNARRVTVPFEAAEAAQLLEDILDRPGVTLLHQPLDTTTRWLELIKQHGLRGRNVFDAQLVAAMQANDIHSIYTYNEKDFQRFDGIEVRLPQ